MEQIIDVLKNSEYDMDISSEDIQNCWSLINDSYINDVHLIYPPHIIAMACMFITISLQNNNSPNSSTNNSVANILSQENLTPAQEKFNKFMAESQVDLMEVMDTIQQQITLYDHWDKYHEPWIKFLLHTLYLRPVMDQTPAASLGSGGNSGSGSNNNSNNNSGMNSTPSKTLNKNSSSANNSRDVTPNLNSSGKSSNFNSINNSNIVL